MFLITTDLHLTDRTDEQYRFDLFPWLRQQCKDIDVARIFILGDLTDFKNNHSARLVNKIVDSLVSLTEVCPVTILKGNHDFVDKDEPFFKFLNYIDGIDFIVDINVDFRCGGKSFMLLPFTRTPNKDWENLDFSTPDFILMHQTFSGAMASNGQLMDGDAPREILGKTKAKIFSGDIHVPQTLGPITYVGAPYRIRFVDSFRGRCLILSTDGKTSEIHLPTLQRHTVYIDEPEELLAFDDIRSGDQIKIRIRVPKANTSEWSIIKDETIKRAREKGLNVFALEAIVDAGGRSQSSNKDSSDGISFSNPKLFFESYCVEAGISEYDRDIGRLIMEEK